MRISDWSSDVCSSDLVAQGFLIERQGQQVVQLHAVMARPAQMIGDPLRLHPVGEGFHLRQILAVERIAAADRQRHPMQHPRSSEERSVGKESVSTCNSRGSPYH